MQVIKIFLVLEAICEGFFSESVSTRTRKTGERKQKFETKVIAERLWCLTKTKENEGLLMLTIHYITYAHYILILLEIIRKSSKVS